MAKLNCQKELFSLDDDVKYLNCAAYGPFLTSCKNAGVSALELKSNPQNISAQDHFDKAAHLREKLSTLVNANDQDRIALFPSVAYGLAIVARNLHRLKNISSKKTILTLENEFPNNFYAFDRVKVDLDLNIQAITQPPCIRTLGEDWNRDILASINDETALIILPHVHWIFGVVFDLEKISKKCKEHAALLIIDGTQSIGAMPFDVDRIQPDALICATYKWLFGPYGTSFGYFGEFFDDGVPLEETWMNRLDSDQFSNITNLQSVYRPKAQRYNMGEFSSFIYVEMTHACLDQVLDWKVSSIQNYIREITTFGVEKLRNLGCEIVADEYRAPHLFGITLPENTSKETADILMAKLKKEKIIVSVRGGSIIRVSINVFNEENDLQSLADILESIIN